MSDDSLKPESNLERITHKLARTSLFMSAALLLYLRPFALPGLKMLLRLLKHLAAAFSRVTSWLGILSALLGLLVRSPTAFVAGIISYIVSVGYFKRLPPLPDVEIPENSCEITTTSNVAQYRTPSPIIHRNYAFTIITGDDGEARDLLCDVWQPPECVTPSGVAFVNFHGGAWHSLNKGILTGTQFRQLTANGHSVVDVAYRLHPETNMPGMLNDVARAVAWVKNGGGKFNLDAKQLILMGGSAGGHLALMHAYTTGQPGWHERLFTDLDLRVDGVVAFYPPVDLRAYLAYSPSGLAPAILGGAPDEVPEAYTKYSPINQVHADCPPTLLLHGTHDYVVPVEPVRELHCLLDEAGVENEYVEYPANEHGFDLFLPQISPSAKSALAHVQRFALQVSVS